MSRLLQSLIKQAEILNSTEQLSLAVYLIENVKQSSSFSFSPRRQWSEIRGLASSALWDEDAQSAISKMRQESDVHREAGKLHQGKGNENC